MKRPRKAEAGKAFRVTWLDAHLLSGTWTHPGEEKLGDVAECYSYGISLGQDDLYLTLAGSIANIKHQDGTISDVSYGDVNRILLSTIIEVKEIK